MYICMYYSMYVYIDVNITVLEYIEPYTTNLRGLILNATYCN